MNTQLPKYPAYKYSGIEWLGLIPSHWEVKKLKYILKFKTGGTPSSGTESFYNGNESWVTISDLKGRWTDETHFISKKGIRAANIPLVKMGSLLFSFKLSVGQVAFAHKDLYTNEAIAAFSNDNTNLTYWYYSLPLFVIQNAAVNIYGAKILNQELINNAFLLSPPLSEQSTIAQFLDDKTAKIDQAIAQKQKMIALLKERKQIIIQEAVTKGLNPHIKLKNSGVEWIGEIPEHWEVKRLKYVGKIVLGKMICNQNMGGMFLKPYLKSKNIQWLKVDISSVDEMWFTKLEMEQYKLQKDDLILSEGGDVGKTCIWNNELVECYIQNSAHKVTINSDCNPFFYLYLFNHIGKQGAFESIINKVSIGHLTKEKLINIIIVKPPIQEQTAIVSFIESQSAKIDRAISLQEKQIEGLKEYKSTLIDSAVTGKIKISE